MLLRDRAPLTLQRPARELVKPCYSSSMGEADGPEASSPDYDDNGVDRTLVRRMLAMTPTERVKYHAAVLADVERLARAGAIARRGHP